MLKVKINYPSKEEEKLILSRMGTLGELPHVSPILKLSDLTRFKELVESVYIDEKVSDYILNIVLSTRSPKEIFRTH